MSSRSIVVTTINAPTDALRALVDAAGSWEILVVGDRKTPPDWSLAGTRLLPWSEQRALPYRLAEILPDDHYCRKNLGYLAAIEGGAQIIAETDDDNFPGIWPPPDFAFELTAPLIESTGWVNVYRYFTDETIWPRGLPLDEISADTVAFEQLRSEARRPLVHQYLAEGDPDVDAIYRLTVGKVDHVFADRTVVLDPFAAVPFNSQSTIWSRDVAILLYLPSLVSFRMTDIWRSFVAQRCLWALGSGIAYHGKGVRQERNAHDLMRDFSDETDGYLRNAEIMNELRSLELSSDPADLEHSLRACYQRLVEIGVVPAAELDLLEAWIDDFARASARA